MIVCKLCGSINVVKDGERKGVQYYWCKDCRHRFAGNDALPGMRFPPEQIAAAVSLFYEGLSLEGIQTQMAELYGERPSDSTIYEWIVRFTKEAVAKAGDFQAHTGDVWAADETVPRVSVILLADVKKRTAGAVASSSRDRTGIFE